MKKEITLWLFLLTRASDGLHAFVVFSENRQNRLSVSDERLYSNYSLINVRFDTDDPYVAYEDTICWFQVFRDADNRILTRGELYDSAKFSKSFIITGKPEYTSFISSISASKWPSFKHAKLGSSNINRFLLQGSIQLYADEPILKQYLHAAEMIQSLKVESYLPERQCKKLRGIQILFIAFWSLPERLVISFSSPISILGENQLGEVLIVRKIKWFGNHEDEVIATLMPLLKSHKWHFSRNFISTPMISTLISYKDDYAQKWEEVFFQNAFAMKVILDYYDDWSRYSFIDRYVR
jgi:hypothetical protein